MRAWVWARSPYTGGGLVAHLALAESADDDGIVNDDANVIAVLTRTTAGHVRRIIAELVDEGLAEVVEPKRGRKPAVIRLVVDAPTGTSTSPLTHARARQPDPSTRRRARQTDDDAQAHLFLNEVKEGQDNTPPPGDVSTRTRARRERQPREHEAAAREITRRVWDALDPKPAVPFVAISKIAEALLAAPWPADAIVEAMCAVPTISTRWVEARLRQGPHATQRRDMIDDARDTPGGRIQL